MKFTPKFKVHIVGVKGGVSRVKALKALAEVMEIDVNGAKYYLDAPPAHPPYRFLSTLGSERFISVVLSEEELKEVQAQLDAFFELSIVEAEENTLVTGNFCPWSPAPVPTAVPVGFNLQAHGISDSK